jgi:RimJ/RimL family protein N-acetyltransferase
MEPDDSSTEPIYSIVGERVALGPVRRELLPLYTRWINDFGTLRTLFVPPMPMSDEAEADWFEGASRRSDGAFFTIYEKASARPIGNTSIDLNFRHRRGNLGIMIGEPDARGKGFGTEAVRLMLDFAFTAHGLHNVMLTVYEYNLAGIRCYEKAGFREFGRRRECHYMGGRLWDEIFMDVLATEFEGYVLKDVLKPDVPR